MSTLSHLALLVIKARLQSSAEDCRPERINFYVTSNLIEHVLDKTAITNGLR